MANPIDPSEEPLLTLVEASKAEASMRLIAASNGSKPPTPDDVLLRMDVRGLNEHLRAMRAEASNHQRAGESSKAFDVVSEAMSAARRWHQLHEGGSGG